MDDCQHDLAGDGAIEPEPEQKTGDERETNQRKIVADIAQTKERDIAEQGIRLRRVVGFRAPNQLGGVLQDEEERVGDEHQHHLVPAIKKLQHAALEQRPQDQGDRERGPEHQQIANERRSEVAAIVPADRAGRPIGADGEQAAMGKVENVEHAEHERQPNRYDEQPRGVDDAVDQDRCRKFHARSLHRGKAERMRSAPLCDSSARLAGHPHFQSHLAPGKPCAIQSADLTPGGGFTHSAAKRSMSTNRTILASGSHFDRPAAFDWMA